MQQEGKESDRGRIVPAVTLVILLAIALAASVQAACPITANTTRGSFPLTVSFTWSGNNTNSSLQWDFGDGAYSDGQNPVHTYSLAGDYDVCCTVTNQTGKTSCCSPGLVTVTPVDVPDLAGTTTCISTLSRGIDQTSPSILGEQIAWVSMNASTHLSEIHVYHTGNGTEELIPPADPFSGKDSPSLGGEGIAYIDKSNTTPAVMRYDFRSKSVTRVTPVGFQYDAISVHSANETLVFTAMDLSTGMTRVFLYETGSQTLTPLAAPGDWKRQGGAVTNDRFFAWIAQSEERGECAIILQERGNTSATVLVTTPSLPQGLAITGNYLAWSGGDEDSRITLCSLVDRKTSQIPSPGGSNVQVLPALLGQYLAWAERRGDAMEILRMNLQNGALYRLHTTASGVDVTGLAISGERVVYEDTSSGSHQVFLITPGSTGTCPVAGFTADHTTGSVPLSVNFSADVSSNPAGYHWEFGDGNRSEERNPSHVYMTAGQFTVTLSVHTSACRDSVIREDFITSQSPPTPGITATPVGGIAPLTVQFQSSGTGEAGNRLWDFGDGTRSSDENPTHTYTTPGSFTVNLTVSNIHGNATLSRAGLITVVTGGGNAISLVLPGLSLSRVNGTQFISANPSGVPGLAFDPSDPGYIRIRPGTWGLPESVIITAPSGERFYQDNPVISGPVGYVTISGSANAPPLFTTLPMKAACVDFVLSAPEYPEGGSLSWEMREGVLPSEEGAFMEALSGSEYSGVNATAYTVRFIPAGFPNGTSANLTFAVDASWVVNNCEPHYQTGQKADSVMVFRLADDGTTALLDTQVLGQSLTTNVYTYNVQSPSGLSTFALSSLYRTGNPFQMLYMSLGSRAGSSSSGGGGGGGGGGSGSIQEAAPTPQVTATVSSARPKPAETQGIRATPAVTGTAVVTRPAGNGVRSEAVAPVAALPSPLPAPGETTQENTPLGGWVPLIRNLAIGSATVFISFVLFMRWWGRDSE